jgi:putative nucleotidyltransferase with HDIG domain
MGIILSIILGFALGAIFSSAIYKKRRSPVSLPHRQKISTPVPPSLLEEKIWYQKEMEFVFNLDEKLSVTLDHQKIAQHLVEAAYNFLGLQRSILLLWDKNNDNLTIEYAAGWERSFNEPISLKDEDNISKLIVSRKGPLMINDLKNEHYFRKINKEDYLRKSFISVPLMFQENVLGVLHACDKKSEAAFNDRDFSFMLNIARLGAISFQNVRMYEQMQDDYLKTMTALALAVDARDSYTRWHSENVARYSVAIAKKMQCRPYETETIRKAALLHDIGKIGIKDQVLLKPGKLTGEEFEQIKLHPAKGAEIIKPLSFLKEVSPLIKHHHERCDGSGYPDGIKAREIELGARILAAADVFDALISDRPYHKGLSVEESLMDLDFNKGTKYDPRVIECLLEVVKENPSIIKPPLKQYL